jgi:ABC-type Fe3+/spermidine/putrescine transport system ATPase subunit
MKIEANNLVRRFKSYIALDDVSLGVKEGKLLALYWGLPVPGTTLLRVIVGLDYPDSGSIRFDDQDATGLANPETESWFRISTLRSVPAYECFQEYSFWPGSAFPEAQAKVGPGPGA